MNIPKKEPQWKQNFTYRQRIRPLNDDEDLWYFAFVIIVFISPLRKTVKNIKFDSTLDCDCYETVSHGYSYTVFLSFPDL